MTQRRQVESGVKEHNSCNTLPYRRMRALSYSAARMGLADQRFGERLREWRSRRNLSGQALGDKIGADSSRISRLEKGTENPTLDTLDKLAAALDVDVSVLLEPRPEESGHVAGGSDGSEILAAYLARIDEEAPAEDSWRGDVIQAIAVLTRALRRPAPGEPASPPAKTGS